MMRDPETYRDSHQMFDSPLLMGLRLHCPHRQYLSHCSWSKTPGSLALLFSSASFSCFALDATNQVASRSLRRPTLSWLRTSISSSKLHKEKTKMIIQVYKSQWTLLPKFSQANVTFYDNACPDSL